MSHGGFGTVYEAYDDRMDRPVAIKVPGARLLATQRAREEFLRVFPNAAGLNERFETLEAWFAENYAPLEQAPVNIGGYQLWHILREGG